MLQTSILRTVRMAPPKPAPAAPWRRYRVPRLPQITVILGMLALLCGVLWGVNEYEEHRAELRRAETSRYLDQFRSGPVAAAWRRLGAAWQTEQHRQHALLVRLASLDDSDRAQALRDHRMLVLETIEEYGLHDEIEEVSRFLARLAICVRAGSCDLSVTAAQLGPALWAFRDQHEPYLPVRVFRARCRRVHRDHRAASGETRPVRNATLVTTDEAEGRPSPGDRQSDGGG